MSAAAREPDDPGPLNDGPSYDGPLKYAPKRARQPKPDRNFNSAPPKVNAEPTVNNAEPPEPPWRRKRKHGFGGDIAIAELHVELARTPDQIPKPPLPKSTVRVFGAKGQVIGVIAVAAAGAVGYLWSSTTPAGPPSSDRADLVPTVGAAQHASTPATSPPGSFVPQPSGQDSRDPPRPQAALPQLTINVARPWLANEPARLPISTVGAGSEVDVVIGGLAPGSILSAGTQVGPDRWRVSAKDFSNTMVTPPRGFVGVMHLTLELRLADETVADRGNLQLEWSRKSVVVSAASSQRHLDAAEIALLMKKGLEFMANGNIGAARLMFQPAAEAGEAMAAFALAETYDPLVLEKLAAKGGITPDVALAHAWYERAKELGSTVAPERMARLARRSE